MRVAKEILDLVPYVPGKPISETLREFCLDRVVKLASNESPIGPSEKAVEAIKASMADLHRYPESSSYALKAAAAKYYKVPENWITFGNGSNELIDLLMKVFCVEGDACLTSKYAFIAYKISAQASRLKLIEIPMTSGWGYDSQVFKVELEQNVKKRIRLVFIANPNNPTGTYLSRNEVTEILGGIGEPEETIVVLDEAYFEFVQAEDYANGIELLQSHPNLVVLRTFSKVFGLASLRLGALIGNPKIIDLVDRVRNPFNVNTAAAMAGVAALGDASHINKVCKLTWDGLKFWEQGLRKAGIEFIPSQGNFILADVKTPALPLYQDLLKKGVILRPVNNYGLPHHLRISVGLKEENEFALEKLLDLKVSERC